MKEKAALLTMVFAALLLTNCSNLSKTSATKQLSTLKDAYKDDFLIGTAVNVNQIKETNPRLTEVEVAHFNAVTPENIMKAEILQPEKGRYDFELADQMVDQAKRRNMLINAHALIWHSQLPGFVRRMKDADSVRHFFKDHITTVATRYKDKVYSWDVVNEALNEDGTMRKSIFLDKMGEEFVVEAFRLTQAVSPETKLYYNDYNIEQPKKRAGAIRLIKQIQAAGVRIDGVGIQGHWNVNNIPMKDIEDSILEFAALGVDVMFTELDISVLPHPFQSATADISARAEYQAKMNPYAGGLPDSVQNKLADGYEALFRLFLKHKDKIGRVTLWGVSDADSWLNNWPVRGRTNYPLLFDRELKPKPAFDQIMNIKQDVSLTQGTNHGQLN